MLIKFLIAAIFLIFSCSGENTENNSPIDLPSSSSSESDNSSSSEAEQSSSSSALPSSSSSSILPSSSSSSALPISSSSSVLPSSSSSSSLPRSSSSSSSLPRSSSSSVLPSSSSSEGLFTPFTDKAAIDAEIEANWKRLGYVSKPTKVIALSFDDGPSSQTQSLLAALAKKEVKTTFFLIGQNITSNLAAAQAMHSAGHELANHSDGYSSNPSQKSVQDCSDKIKNITGSNPTLFRAPSVDYAGGAVDNVCRALNLPMIDVSCWSNDYNGINSAQIRNNVKACASDGKIVNLHEFNTATGNNAAGVEGLIDDLRAAGYWILPVGQMAVYKGKTLVGGQKYSSF